MLKVLRLLSSQFVCDNLHSCAISSIILYTFRVFERRYGSRKFSVGLVTSRVFRSLVTPLLCLGRMLSLAQQCCRLACTLEYWLSIDIEECNCS